LSYIQDIKTYCYDVINSIVVVYILGISLFIAAITTIFIILSYLEQRSDKGQQQLKELKIEVQKQSKSLQDMHSSLKEINVSLENLKMDSISVRLKK